MKSITIEDFNIISEFTITDWENGTIPVPNEYWEKLFNYGKWPYGVETEKIAISHCRYWTMFNNPQLMTKEELEKITQEQRKIFYLAKDIAVNSRAYGFIDFLTELPKYEQEDVLRNEINSTEEKLSNQLKRRVIGDEVSLGYITPAERRWILDKKKAYNRGVRRFTVYNQETGKKHEIIKYDDLFNAHVDYGYLLELKELRSDGLKEYLTPDHKKSENTSNADQLKKSVDWMDPTVKRIMDLEFPRTDEEVRNILEKAYPDLPQEYDFQNTPSNLTKGGKVTKISVCRVLAHIFEQKHEEKIKPNSIYKRYQKQPRKYW